MDDRVEYRVYDYYTSEQAMTGYTIYDFLRQHWGEDFELVAIDPPHFIFKRPRR